MITRAALQSPCAIHYGKASADCWRLLYGADRCSPWFLDEPLLHRHARRMHPYRCDACRMLSIAIRDLESLRPSATDGESDAQQRFWVNEVNDCINADADRALTNRRRGIPECGNRYCQSIACI